MATPSEDADNYNQLVAKIAGYTEENTNPEGCMTPSASSDNLLAQLHKKDLDLKLTAELGQALLEKNDGLQRHNEELTEEYSQRLEELTQEKHELRMRLESIEGQYEVTVRELQLEVAQLREELSDQEGTMRFGERAHTQALVEAKRLNEQLSEQTNKVRGSESMLQSQVNELRNQLRSRRISLQEYLQKVETLREEIVNLTAIRVDLESHVKQLTSERNMHVISLDDAQCRIIALEQSEEEQKEQLMCQEREISELREQNLCLQDNVGHLSLQTTSDLTLDPDVCGNCLFRELRLSNTKSTSTESLDVFSETSVELRQNIVEVHQQMMQMLRDLSHDDASQCDVSDDDASHETPSRSPQVEPRVVLAEVQSGGLQSLLLRLREQTEQDVTKRVNQMLQPTVVKARRVDVLERKTLDLQNDLDAALVALNDFSCGTDQTTSTSDLVPQPSDDLVVSSAKTTSTESLETDAFSQQAVSLRHETVEVYRELKQMVDDLDDGKVGQGHGEHMTCSQMEPQQALCEVHSGALRSLLLKFRQQMEHVMNSHVNQMTEPSTPEHNAPEHNEALERRVEQLQGALAASDAALNKLKVKLSRRETELERKSDKFRQLTSEIKLSLQRQEFVTIQLERDRLQDQTAGVITRDDIIERARQSRDDAISRRNAMDVELARSKLDLMNLDRQLMEAIQQKLALSQQLEQWQMDLEVLVDTQMTKRMELEAKKVSRVGAQSVRSKFKFSWS